MNLLKSPLLKLLKSLPLRAWRLLQVLLRPVPLWLVLLSLLRRRREDVEEAVEASAQPAQAEFAPVEAEFEHDYENDPVFGEATVEPGNRACRRICRWAVAASAEDSVEPGEDMGSSPGYHRCQRSEEAGR